MKEGQKTNQMKDMLHSGGGQINKHRSERKKRSNSAGFIYYEGG
jgi:hypothetical protein